jgi:phosphoribosylaminoimidazolecarboxamide formyltransferase / IMP cyclohydrolase
VPRIQRALISVSDKLGLAEFASVLHGLGIEILSTGGTLKALESFGIPARSVASVTGFPEILDGRVKTLHPAIHGALLAVADNPEHMRQLAEHGITPIDMVVVNLYPFAATVSRPGVTLAEAVEQIDIGGPSMLRSTAKNFRHKAVIVNPARYSAVIDELRANNGTLSESTCASLAREVFHHTARYDAMIATYLDSAITAETELPTAMTIAEEREMNLRYGENPHQRAALYGSWTALFRQLHGKELSYNNIVDASAAALLAAEFSDPTVVIVKHTNPCGVGSADTLDAAYDKAFATDTKSPYGGIVAVNRPLDFAAAEKINAVFTEVLIAPEFPPDVIALLQKKKDRRLLRLSANLRTMHSRDVRSVPGGFLVQESDVPGADNEEFRVVTRRSPTAEEERALRFAWRVTKHVKSNAIVYTAADRTLGIGAGQMSRVDSAHIAAEKAREAGLSLKGSVVGSDAFFPFPDGLLEAVHAGSTAVIQPGGSIRDAEVIAAADEHNIAMVFTSTRHFRH